MSATQSRALAIADNQLALGAGWDEELLRLELAALQKEDFKLDVIGFDDEELNRLLDAAETFEGLVDEDAVPAVPANPICRPGELWTLGAHRLARRMTPSI